VSSADRPASTNALVIAKAFDAAAIAVTGSIIFIPYVLRTTINTLHIPRITLV